ncbi:hypothetical protein DSO57_1029812 [Entomophthora muscae]|uniref:Uncharacterized protein n=1 Tax=Entomophthora muscae TaxID=34485 RepID=A0ACC2SQG4_9FUNG|nr:hypothetical protein DSO57_1029812 [Entomophthora muscae]
MISIAVKVLSVLSAGVFCDKHQPYVVKPGHYLGQVIRGYVPICSGFFVPDGSFFCPNSCLNTSSRGLRLLKAGADGGFSTGPVVRSIKKTLLFTNVSEYIYSEVNSGLGVGNLLPLEFTSPSLQTVGSRDRNYFTVVHFNGKVPKETVYIQVSQEDCYRAYRTNGRSLDNSSPTHLSHNDFIPTYFCAVPKHYAFLKATDQGAPCILPTPS